ncbi:MAG TPA: quinolinate synthase NadA, partial [Gammaproteobacteria bacterium]|nr:quinolinate synthase NadA [Gammaproteobacteria bacterium]
MAVNAIDVDPYTSLSDEDCEARIIAAKEKLGERLVILGHHYQRDEVFRHADFSGDSLKLSRQAASS